MSENPFNADAALQRRYADRIATIGAAVGGEVSRRAVGGVLPAGAAAELIAGFGLADIRELMILSLDAAKGLAQPPISGFYVGAVGLERETGDLVLGGNVEFPGTTLVHTIHGEGFVSARAYSRNTTISTLAIGEAHPCAHCRQFLSEFAASRELQLIDPLGHELTMAQLYPWPFDPAYLGEPGIVAGAVHFPNLRFNADAPADKAVADALLTAGRRSHAPYGKCPAAIVVQVGEAEMFAGSVIESVAFNPGMGPLQPALINLLAHGRSPAAITRAWLGTVEGGRVDHRRSVAELLSVLAPGASLYHFGWQA